MTRLSHVGWKRLAIWSIVLLLALLAIPLRFYHLAQVSPDFHFDEGYHAVDALGVLNGQHALFFPANNGREGLIVYAVAGAIKLFGPTIFAVRFPTALASVAAVLILFWFGQILFRPTAHSRGMERWRGLIIGGVAGGSLAVSLGQSILGRSALRGNFLPPLFALGLGLLWSGVARRSWGRIAGAGFCVGLLAYTYIPARLMPVLLVAFGLTFVWTAWRQSGSRGVGDLVRAQAAPVALFVGVAGLVAAPLLIYFMLHPENFVSRSNEVWLFSSPLFDGNVLSTLARNLWNQLAVLGFVGDPQWRANYAGWPMLNPAEAIFFWLGVGVALWRWRGTAYRLLLLWLGIMLIPALLSFDLPHSTLRMIGMIPAIYLCIGLGVWESLAWIARRLERTRLPGRHLFAPGMMGLIAVALVAQGLWVHHVIHQRWVPALYNVLPAPSLEWRDLVDRLNALPPGTPEMVVIPYLTDHDFYFESSFAFLDQGKVPVYFTDLTQPDAAQALEAALVRDLPAGGAVQMVTWEREPMADSTGRLPFLLGLYGHRMDTTAYQDYTVTAFTDLDLTIPWQLPLPAPIMAVPLDVGITLTGAALTDHGGRPLPLSAPTPARFVPSLGQPVGLALRWQADRSPDYDCRISLRWVAADGAVAFQQDDGLWNAMHLSTSAWASGESMESLHLLTLPPELAPGVYTLVAVVYNQESLVPTVQVGLWQPEINLGAVRVE